jgi:hypothetical protein
MYRPARRMSNQGGFKMLWSILLILSVFWLLGIVSGYTMDDAIHILLLFAVVAMLLKIEDDYSNYGSWLTKKRYLKRHLISRFGKMLPNTWHTVKGKGLAIIKNNLIVK